MNKDDIVDILLIEDNPNDVEMALRSLKKNKLTNRVHVARDGEEALNFIFCKGDFIERNINDIPKMILLDLKLPKINGLEVLKQIKNDPRTQKIPVVVLTISRDEEDSKEAYRLGVNSYILKPVDFDQFINSVRQIGFYWMLINEFPKFD